MTADRAMPDMPQDPYAPDDPALREDLAGMLGDPLPANWRDPRAIAARQDRLAATAAIVGEAALECVRAYLDMRQRHPQVIKLYTDIPVLRRFGEEMAELYAARLCYIRETQRGDGSLIVMEALTCSCGATIATVVDSILDNLIREPPATGTAE